MLRVVDASQPRHQHNNAVWVSCDVVQHTSWFLRDLKNQVVSTQLPSSEMLSFVPLPCLSEELRTPQNDIQNGKAARKLVAPVAGYERVVDIVAYT
ncbi:hypothetical protein CY34DRAFT_808444 [Suillus luteus UH-Slu-Lm8-n1]|uniref:Uncharacterized protein n=1 Tax=Suillus luteus UH-Slu-Lm8-n1 TaxID=930992 RepID=A0A0D0AYA1_9AGAM|nr:hypothetical protein CY34DRAFT_808444 [Suillus luteus UH-Slu-Lm8-n1]